MNDYVDRFLASPMSFKKSFAMLAAAWLCHPLFLYSLFRGTATVEGAEQAILKMAVVSLCLAILLFLIKKWARALVVVGNLFIVINDLFFFAIIPHNNISTLLCVIVALFTVTGTYWLFMKDTRDYFNRVNPDRGASEGRGTGK